MSENYGEVNKDCGTFDMFTDHFILRVNKYQVKQLLGLHALLTCLTMDQYKHQTHGNAAILICLTDILVISSGTK